MTPIEWTVTAAGLAAIAFIVWFFWLKKDEGTFTVTSSDGYQEAMILVKGGYTPHTIVVERGRPVRLKFRREETSACSETVVLGDFGKSARLPEGQVVPVEFVPETAGTYEFSCQMGMIRGRLVVN